MKNVQVIDGADNSTYSIYAFTDDQFSAVFPAPGQDIEFIEDLVDRLGEADVGDLLRTAWSRLQNKPNVAGIHGTLFYGLVSKKRFYPTKIDAEMTSGLQR